MEKVVLKAKYIDVVKVVAKTTILPFFFGVLFAFFTSKNQANVLIVAVPAFLFATIFCAFILSNSPPATLVENGIIYKDWRGRDGLFSPWHNEIRIDSRYIKKTGTHIIKDVAKNKTIRVFCSVFLYPEVKEFISKHCPDNHELRKVIASDA